MEEESWPHERVTEVVLNRGEGLVCSIWRVYRPFGSASVKSNPSALQVSLPPSHTHTHMLIELEALAK